MKETLPRYVPRRRNCRESPAKRRRLLGSRVLWSIGAPGSQWTKGLQESRGQQTEGSSQNHQLAPESSLLSRLGPDCGDSVGGMCLSPESKEQRSTDIDQRSTDIDQRSTGTDDQLSTDIDQCSTDINQCSTDIAQSSTDTDQLSTDIDQCSTDISQRSTDADQCSTDISQRSTNTVQRSTDIDQSSIDIDQSSDISQRSTDTDQCFTDVNQSFTDISQRFTDIDQSSIDIDQRSADIDQRSTDIDQCPTGTDQCSTATTNVEIMNSSDSNHATEMDQFLSANSKMLPDIVESHREVPCQQTCKMDFDDIGGHERSHKDVSTTEELVDQDMTSQITDHSPKKKPSRKSRMKSLLCCIGSLYRHTK